MFLPKSGIFNLNICYSSHHDYTINYDEYYEHSLCMHTYTFIEVTWSSVLQESRHTGGMHGLVHSNHCLTTNATLPKSLEQYRLN
jgi:hypothetical protein